MMELITAIFFLAVYTAGVFGILFVLLIAHDHARRAIKERLNNGKD
jgi:hypothetical protein